jgi:hypothetical protein
VLACFSAADLDLPYQRIADTEHLTVLAPERRPPAALSYPDLVAAADVVVSKPGYGIVSECVANGDAAALHLARTIRRVTCSSPGCRAFCAAAISIDQIF